MKPGDDNEQLMKPGDDTEFRSPRDSDGHRTHTASMAAGSHFSDASIFGFFKGTIGGMASKAKIAMYKACWVAGCSLGHNCGHGESN